MGFLFFLSKWTNSKMSKNAFIYWLYCFLIYQSNLSCITIRNCFFELFNYYYFGCKIILGNKDQTIIIWFDIIKGDIYIIIFCNLGLIVIWLRIISKGTIVAECNMHLLFLVLLFTDWRIRWLHCNIDDGDILFVDSERDQ